MKLLGILLIVLGCSLLLFAGSTLVGQYSFLGRLGAKMGGKAAVFLMGIPAYFLIQWGRNCLREDEDLRTNDPLP